MKIIMMISMIHEMVMMMNSLDFILFNHQYQNQMDYPIEQNSILTLPKDH